MRWVALNRREWPKVAPNKTPCCTDWYSALWLYSTELLNGSEYIWGALATDLDSWKSSKSISHINLWMIWSGSKSRDVPPALQHKSLEQYVIWTTAPHWSVEPDDGWAWLSPQTNWCWPLIPYSHLFPGYEFRSCWQTNMPHWHCKHIGDWRAVQSVHLREEWGHVWTSIMCGHMMRHISKPVERFDLPSPAKARKPWWYLHLSCRVWFRFTEIPMIRGSSLHLSLSLGGGAPQLRGIHLEPSHGTKAKSNISYQSFSLGGPKTQSTFKNAWVTWAITAFGNLIIQTGSIGSVKQSYFHQFHVVQPRANLR